MIIDLASVQTMPKPLTAEIDGAQIDLEGDGSVNGAARFDGETFREGTKVHLRGTIATDVRVECARCAEPLTRHLDIPFEDVFVNAAEETNEKDLEVEGSDLDEQLVIGNEIDLTETIREQILLNLPEQVLCKEDCKGLCPQCGANRNLLDCDCGKEDIDPRWAALKDLS
jgi:uncharacterized protein